MSSHPSAGSPGALAGSEERSARDQNASLYEKREKIQMLWVRGRFQRLRNVTLTVLILFFFALPWLQWDGRPAVWLDLPRRKFMILGLTFWPQDLVLLSWLLIIAAFGLFFFTVWGGGSGAGTRVRRRSGRVRTCGSST